MARDSLDSNATLYSVGEIAATFYRSRVDRSRDSYVCPILICPQSIRPCIPYLFLAVPGVDLLLSTDQQESVPVALPPQSILKCPDESGDRGMKEQ